MAKQIKEIRAVLTINVATNEVKVLNTWVVNDTVQTDLEKSGAADQRVVSQAEKDGLLSFFLTSLVSQASMEEGV